MLTCTWNEARSQQTEPAADARQRNRRGIARLEGGDACGALADFRAAAALQPDYAEAWNNAGLVRQMLGHPREALADFDRALALRPEYAEALSNRGRARQALGDPAGARADFDQALDLAGASRFAASVLLNRGQLRREQEDFAGAVADLDRALDLVPEDVVCRVARGLARKEAGDLQGALADFDRALAQNPADGLATVYHGRGGVRVLLNDFAGALADYDRALSLDPEKFHYYISRGNARYHRRDPRAVLDLRMAFRLDPEGAARDLLRILREDVRRDAAKVLDNCTRHLRINDRDVIACARRGLTLVLLGREAEAAPDLERVRELVPDMVPHLQRVLTLARACPDEFSSGTAPPAAGLGEDAIDAVFAEEAHGLLPPQVRSKPARSNTRRRET